MRATVTIGDELFTAADRTAKKLGVSRSRLIQNALEAYLRSIEEQTLTERMNSVLERLNAPADAHTRKHVAEAWRRSMGGDEW